MAGVDPYPPAGVPARQVGPFPAVGAWPATRRVIVVIDPWGATVADVADVAGVAELGATQDQP